MFSPLANVCQGCITCHALDYLTENPQKSYGVEIMVSISHMVKPGISMFIVCNGHMVLISNRGFK